MHFRTHLISSVVLGLGLYPRSPVQAAMLIGAGTLIDVDHLVVYALHTGDWSVAGALVYDRYRHYPGGAGDNRPRYGSLRSLLHEPWLLLPLIWLGALQQPKLRPIAIGLSLHLAMDYVEWPLFRLAYQRAQGRCESCGRRDRKLTVYRRKSWGGSGFRTLCRSCFEQGLRELRQATT